MNKAELVTAIAEKSQMTKKDSEKALQAFVDAVTEELGRRQSATRWLRHFRRG